MKALRLLSFKILLFGLLVGCSQKQATDIIDPEGNADVSVIQNPFIPGYFAEVSILK